LETRPRTGEMSRAASCGSLFADGKAAYFFGGNLMAARKNSMPKQVPMYLDERLSEGFVIVCVCAGGGGEHSFVMRGLGPSIECPHCGRTALSSQLIDAYYEQLGRATESSVALIRARPLKAAVRRVQDGGAARSLR
jgi:hypothetical protein